MFFCYRNWKLQQGLYNHPKHDDHITYIDDGSDNQPYRHLKHYYIYKKAVKTRKYVPLPINPNTELPRDLVIAGWLQPPPSNNGMAPVFVVFENIKARAVIDRTRGNRGYWIEINSSSKKKGSTKTDDTAWYYLQDPCNHPPSPTLESQAKIQWDATIILTCVSVLLDQVLAVDPAYLNQTIEDTLHRSSLLLLVEKHHKEILFDFELSIIANYKAMILHFLDKSVPGCELEKCSFMKSISKLKKPKIPPNALAVHLWVRAISIQLHQQLWGGTISDTSNTHLDDEKPKTTDIEFKQTFKGKNESVKKRQISPEDGNAITDRSIVTKAKKSKFSDDNIFSAVALKEQLKSAASRIPNIRCISSMEDWTEATAWESLVANVGSSFMLEGDADDAKKFYNHIMLSLDTKKESMVMAIYALTTVSSESKYYKLLMSHKNEAGQRPVAFIFNNMMGRSLEILNQRVRDGQSIKQMSAMYILANILTLVASRNDIRSTVSLSKLIERTNVDLNSRMDEVCICDICDPKKMLMLALINHVLNSLFF